MANKILVARGTKARIETIKGTLSDYEIVYATDTNELGVKKADGNVEYFYNQTALDTILGSSYIKATHAGLVTLRDNEELIPGAWYRITDYMSDKNQFDILVLALDEKTLSEEARAMKSEGDTYFTNADSKLETWKIWYQVDNVIKGWDRGVLMGYEGIVNISGTASPSCTCWRWNWSRASSCRCSGTNASIVGFSGS